MVEPGQTTPAGSISPRKETVNCIKEAGLTPEQVPISIRRELEFGKVLQSELKQAALKSPEHMRVVTSLLKGEHVKKYRKKSSLKKKMSLSKRAIQKAKQKCLTVEKKRRLVSVHSKIQEDVETFLCRDDNSRANPGKQDCLTVDGQKLQTRVLTDYMYILHEKFMSENIQSKVSRATFYRLRPMHVRFSNFLKNKNCLCQIHQNTALMLQAIKKALPVTESKVTTSPDVFIDTYTTSGAVKDVLDKLTCLNLDVPQWKRIKDKDGKERTKIVTESMQTGEFCKKFLQDVVCKFREHAAKVRIQYREVKRLKEN